MKEERMTSKAKGRPRKPDAPFVPWQKIDEILVFGEKSLDEKSGQETIRYPSFRQLAERYSVSRSLIGKYSRKHNCLKRREENQMREQILHDQEVVKKCAKSRAIATSETVGIIDNYLKGFQEALAEGKIRCDNPSDFNTLVRLREFLQGNADSRQSITAGISLQEIQARHRQLREQLGGLSAALTGMMEETDGKIGPDGSGSNGGTPPNVLN